MIDIKKALFLNKENYLAIQLTDLNVNYVDITAKYLNQGFQIIQLENINLSDLAFSKISKNVRELTSMYNSLFFVKNRFDIALISKADGILLSDNSISFSDCKKFVSNDILIGLNSQNVSDFESFSSWL